LETRRKGGLPPPLPPEHKPHKRVAGTDRADKTTNRRPLTCEYTHRRWRAKHRDRGRRTRGGGERGICHVHVAPSSQTTTHLFVKAGTRGRRGHHGDVEGRGGGHADRGECQDAHRDMFGGVCDLIGREGGRQTRTEKMRTNNVAASLRTVLGRGQACKQHHQAHFNARYTARRSFLRDRVRGPRAAMLGVTCRLPQPGQVRVESLKPKTKSWPLPNPATTLGSSALVALHCLRPVVCFWYCRGG